MNNQESLLGAEDNLKEALVRHSTEYLLNNELINTDPIINDLIIVGFMANDAIEDVGIFIDEKERKIIYHLFFGAIRYHLTSTKKLQSYLTNYIQSGLKNWSVEVIKKKFQKDQKTTST